MTIKPIPIRTLMSLLTCVCGVAASAAQLPRPPMAHAPLGVANGCFVETVAFLDQWKERQGDEAWSRLLQWGARDDEEIVAGHAVAIVEAGGELWCWDINFGWSRMGLDPNQRETAEVVAAVVVKKYPRMSARFPLYRVDFAQNPAATPPTARLEEANTAVRDASLVGARLALKRPVNVVRFYFGPADAKKESAAVVFVFHGRYCIYLSEAGTIPFRLRGGVENIRLIQDLLRRVLPSVTDVRKL
ncbi:MAG: hypothetical protein ABIQ12_10815 [Opitutaceae bacterium]